MKNPFQIALLTFFCLLPLCHAEAQSSPIQADGIVSRVTDQLWNQTDRYWHQGDYPRIVALDRIITQADPTFVESYATGGWLMESMGNLDDAEAFYSQAVVHNPGVAYAYWTLAMFYFNTRHDYPAAIRMFTEEIRLPGAEFDDWKMLAHSYEKANDWDEAVPIWEQIKARWPNGLNVDYELRRARTHQAAQRAAQP